MTDTKYTEEEIKWAINELKKKHPERANRDQAIKLLDTFVSFGKLVKEKVEKDKKSGKVKEKESN